MKKTCVQCKKEFVLTDSEIAFYKSKGLSLPKRCKDCRDANRKTKAGMNSGNIAKNYNRDITVDTVTTKNRKSVSSSQKSNAKPFHYIVAFFVVLVVGIGVFLSSNGSSDETLGNASGGVFNHQQTSYNFANQEALNDHFQKHGYEFGYTSAEQYLQGAIRVIGNPSALKRTQADGDYAYYLQSTNEFVVVSPTGTIRTYFKPDDGIAYFNRQQVSILNFVA